jgi:hypothetical protein
MVLELFLLYLTHGMMQAETVGNGTERHRYWEELRGDAISAKTALTTATS